MLYNNVLDLLQHIYSIMYKQLNISMDSIFIQMHINWTGKDISINKIRYYKSDNIYRHVYELEKLSPPLGPPPPQSSISRQQAHKQRKAWEEHKVLQRDKGMHTQVYANQGNNGLQFICSSIPLLQCIQGVPYIALQRGNGGSNPSDLEAYGRPRVKWFGHI